jgi:hypothetical protein
VLLVSTPVVEMWQRPFSMSNLPLGFRIWAWVVGGGERRSDRRRQAGRGTRGRQRRAWEVRPGEESAIVDQDTLAEKRVAEPTHRGDHETAVWADARDCQPERIWY